MKKRILICCIIFILIVTGCRNGKKEVKTDVETPMNKGGLVFESNDDNSMFDLSNLNTKIYDKNDNVIGEIERFGLISLIDGGLFYPAMAKGSSYGHEIKDFYMYDIKSGEKYKLGSMEDIIYEVSYARVLLNDHIYTIFTTGDADNKETWTYNLVDFDLKNRSMDIIFSDKNTYLYNDMDSIGDDLLILRHNDGVSSIKRYDTKKKTFTELKQYTYDYNNEIGETIYKLYYNELEGSIYTIRCQYNATDSNNLFIDKCDKHMNLISSTEITSDAIYDYDEADTENNSEKRQPVFGFFCQNNYMYYENRSISRIVGKIENNSIISLVNDCPNDYAAAISVKKGNKIHAFCKPFNEDNPLYALDTESGEMKETSFKVKSDDRYCIEGVYQYGDKLLLDMGDREIHASDEREPRLYLLDLNEN